MYFSQLALATNDTNDPEVKLIVNGLSFTMDNGLISVKFGNDATISSLIINVENLVDNIPDDKQSFCLDYYSKSINVLDPERLEVIYSQPDRAHVMYLQDKPGFLRLEYHLIMERGLSGIYSYVKANNSESETLMVANMRLVYRFNPKILTEGTNGEREGRIPVYSYLSSLKKIQDETWQFPDGNYYSKYDYAAYIREHSHRGVFGGGYGAWMLLASHEYYSGGPLKQDLHVHQDALILNCLTASHFGTPDMAATPGWSKLYGPWLMYFNQGTNDEVKADAIRQSKVEQSLWPYKWMNEKDYPLIRGQLTGRVIGPERIMVVLHSSLTERFDWQTQGYTYNTETREDGLFVINNIRPGEYKLTAYPLSGYGIGNLVEKEVTITEGKVSAGTLHLDVPTDVLWSIGETNRKSDSYCYSNESRNYIWHTLPPSNLEFHIDRSKINTDWYYAQTKSGTWSIRYMDTLNGKTRILRIGLAGASTNKEGKPLLNINVNRKFLDKLEPESDPSIYRGSLTSGNFYAYTLTIPANLVKNGHNIIDLTISCGSVMYDSINLSIGNKRWS